MSISLFSYERNGELRKGDGITTNRYMNNMFELCEIHWCSDTAGVVAQDASENGLASTKKRTQGSKQPPNQLTATKLNGEDEAKKDNIDAPELFQY